MRQSFRNSSHFELCVADGLNLSSLRLNAAKAIELYDVRVCGADLAHLPCCQILLMHWFMKYTTFVS